MEGPYDRDDVDPTTSSYAHEIGLPFHRYEHVALTARDVMIFRIMAELANPKKAKPRVFDTPIQHPSTFGVIESQDRRLHADLQVLRKLLYTSLAGEPFKNGARPTQQEAILDLVQRHYLEQDDPAFRLWVDTIRPGVPVPKSHSTEGRPTKADRCFREELERELRAENKAWGDADRAHFRSVQAKVFSVQSGARRLFDGGAFIPLLRQSLDRRLHEPTARQRYMAAGKRVAFPLWPALVDTRLRCIVRPTWKNDPLFKDTSVESELLKMDLSASSGRGRPTTVVGSRRRARSEPNTSAFHVADVPKRCGYGPLRWEILFPKIPLSQLYQRSRSRSLCREHIAHLFTRTSGPEDDNPPRTRGRVVGFSARPPPPVSLRVYSPFVCTSKKRHCSDCGKFHRQIASQIPTKRARNNKNPHEPCKNCAEASHQTSECMARCGFCGAPNPIFTNLDPSSPRLGMHGNPHIAPHCPVKKGNRCKCVAFPQFHTADMCQIMCSRECGDPNPPRSGKGHRNAMTCKSRCCMCGINGHSGKECRLQRCRCRGPHLGQDCGWNAACRVPGCGRYLCGLHCWDCGSMEKPFTEGRCRKCWPENNCVGESEQEHA